MKSLVSALVLCSSVAFTTAAFAESPDVDTSDAQTTSDQILKSQVMDRISTDARLSGRVGVETNHGIVTLTGRVPDREQVDWAEEDARGIDGVREVENFVTADVGGD